jgi:hypothetical protein
MSAHSISDDYNRNLMVLVHVGPGKKLDEEAVFVSGALAADRGGACDVEPQGPGGLRDGFRGGRLGRQNRRLYGKRLTTLVTLDRHADVLLVDLALADTVRTVGTKRHGIASIQTDRPGADRCISQSTPDDHRRLRVACRQDSDRIEMPLGPLGKRSGAHAMPGITGPQTYLDKLLFAQRVVKAAQFRFNQRQAVAELCERLSELISALVEREQGHEVPPTQPNNPSTGVPSVKTDGRPSRS